MRLFFGLEVPPQLARELDDWRTLRAPSDGRPVPAADFHITLAFLGELSGHKLDKLVAATDQWAEGSAVAAGELLLDEVGYWPRPGIYWLGPSRWPPELERLAAALGGIGSRLGAPRDKRNYRPHLTLARRCESPPPAPLQMPGWRLPYDTFTLFESRQGRQGVSYRALEHWPLY